ncbi:MAG: flippase-like domain-containing protein [Deltaproteobacteria bacterium]|nr:flippase-like domain-containing protein [Deltaproteobacteria bacterium]
MQRAGYRLWNIIGLLLTVPLLVWTFWDVDIQGLWQSLIVSKLPLLLVVAFINFFIIALKAWRWQLIISATQKVGYLLVALTTVIGFMANNILPMRAGDIIRAIMLGKRGRVSKAMLIASLGVDKIIEGLSMVVVLVVLPFLLPTPYWFRSTAWILGGVMLGLLGLGILINKGSKYIWIDKIPLPLRWRDLLKSILSRMAEGFSVLRRPWQLSKVMIVAIAIWLGQGLMVWLCLRAMSLELSLLAAYLILMVVNVGILAPAAPGNIGTFEFSVVLALSFLGVEKTQALAFALVYHSIQLIPTIIVGIIAFFTAGLRFNDLKDAQVSL